MVELMDRQSIPGSLSRHPDLLNPVISWERLLARNHRKARCRYGIARASWGGGALSTVPMLSAAGVFSTLRGAVVGEGMVESLFTDVVRQLLGVQAGGSSVSNGTDGGALAASEEISGTEVEGNPG